MDTTQAAVWAGYRHRPIHLRRLTTAIIAGGLLIGPALAAESLQRPNVGPGGNNWRPPATSGARALGTQDLNSGLTPADLVSTLLGPGVAVTNVTFSGDNHAAGRFTGGTGIVGFESGIILSSGDIAFVPGPNTQDDATADNAWPGDPDLDALIPGYTTYDHCVLEFDFECQSTQVIQFQYVFTSEEYNEWVNSPYNDVFGFFLNGANIALVPGGGGMAVSINNVNCNNPYNPPTGSFCNLYVNNRCADIPPGTFPCAGVRDTQMDGLTVVLTATGALQPGLNHIKLAIADAGDHVLDSNVFIQGQSFVCGVPSGACCDMAALICQDNVLETNCQGPSKVWSVGLLCSQLNPPCAPVTHPSGADCENPIPITTVPFTDVNTTCGKDNDYTDTCLGYYDNGDDILYVFTVASTRCVDITVIGATPIDNWIGVVLDNVCPPGLTCLASATTSGTVAAITGLTLTPGTYYLMIDRWPLLEDCLNFTLTITDCSTATGACCFADGHCELLGGAVCQAAGGVYHGDLTTCAPGECPQPTGACCHLDGSCTETLQADCADTWLAGLTCTPDPCAPPEGACCFADGSCLEMAQMDCVDAGGQNWLGPGTSCTPNPCVCRGDCDCDGQVNFGDIDYFVAAIPNAEANWAALYATRHGGMPPPCSFANCDITGDGHVNFADIDPFVALIPSTCP